jgi:dienelactone hydrolase
VHALLVALVLSAAPAALPPALLARPDQPRAAGMALTVIADLQAGRFASIEAGFDDRLRAALPPGRLAATWTQLAAPLGRWVSRGESEITTVDGLTLVVVPVELERAGLRVRLAFDAAGRLAGLHVLPAPGPQPLGPRGGSRGAFREIEVTAGAQGWPLPATLTLPSGPGRFPAVVLVHGSGPHDRDETVGGVLVFRDLAEGLAARGIAALRYEKRTHAHRERLATTVVTLDAEVVDDAVAAVALLGGRPEVDARRIFVAGHSLGALLLPRIASRAPSIAGLVGLATPARPLDVALREQLQYLARAGGPGAAAEAAAPLAALATLRRDLVTAPADRPLLGIPAGYWREVLAVDPIAELRQVAVPLLLLQGDRDYQVTPAEHAALGAALAKRPDVTLRSYPALDHLFVAGAGPSRPSDYGRSGHVAVEVIDDVAAFVRSPPRAR